MSSAISLHFFVACLFTVSADECREECSDGKQLAFDGNCEPCPVGTYRKKGIHLACVKCPNGFTTSRAGTVEGGECNVPICSPGKFLDSTVNDCVSCPRGMYTYMLFSKYITINCLLTHDVCLHFFREIEIPYNFFTGYYQQFDQRTSCDQCPPDTTTPTEGSRSPDDCTNK